MALQHDVRSESVPGGTLLAALLNRQIMTLADRGNSSALIGARWADLAASHAQKLVGSAVPIPGAGQHHVIERVVRLDNDHRFARRASRNGLQNPDLLFLGTRNGDATVQAVDAKFSVETARSKQVSIEMLQGLVGLGAFFDQAAGGLDPNAQFVPGLFLSPDSAFTRFVIGRGRGIIRLTASAEEMLLIDVSSAQMFSAIDGNELIEPLFILDRHPAHPMENLLAGVYYFRLARAAIALWVDQKRPLLAFNDHIVPNIDAVRNELGQRSGKSTSAFRIVLGWADDAEAVNRQRAAVDRVSGLRVTGQELREWVQQDAAAANTIPPSMNQVRRRLGAWFRAELRSRLGPINPPQNDLGAILIAIGRESHELSLQLRSKTAEIVDELLVAMREEEDDQASAQSLRSDGESA